MTFDLLVAEKERDCNFVILLGFKNFFSFYSSSFLHPPYSHRRGPVTTCTLCRALLDVVSTTVKCSVVFDCGAAQEQKLISETNCSPCFLLQYPQERVYFSFPRGSVSHQSSPIPLCQREREAETLQCLPCTPGMQGHAAPAQGGEDLQQKWSHLPAPSLAWAYKFSGSFALGEILLVLLRALEGSKDVCWKACVYFWVVLCFLQICVCVLC